MRTNNNGFTLIELLAAITLFAIIASIGTYSITRIIKSSKDKNYDLLLKNIKSAARVYYQECRYANNAKTTGDYDGAWCEYVEFTYPDGTKIKGYTITIYGLVNYGYLTGNSKYKVGSEERYAVVDPRTNENIGECIIGLEYDSGNLIIAPNSPEYCPKNYGDKYDRQ